VRILITGADGQLGRDLRDCLAGRVPAGGRRCALLGPEGPREGLSHDVLATDIGDMPVDDRDAVLSTFTAFRPELVLHGGALTAVDRCETEADLAYAVNALGTRNVAEAAALVGAHMVYVSTDYVFDGTSTRPYREWDATGPASVYGASKLAGEHECRPGSTIVRTSWVCGAHGANMVVTALRLAGSGDGDLHFIDDQHGSPTFTADLAPAIVTLGLDRRPGIFHVTNSGATTWWGFVRAILAEAGADPERVRAISTAELHPPRPAPRPANSVLDNMALRLSGLPALPQWQDGLARLVAALSAQQEEVA
jgi:dTDP-4-dehydrorhamnose reductase